MKLCQIISIALCLIFYSCDKNDNENPLKLDKPILEFPATGGTGVATLENHSSWQVNGLLETIGDENSQYIACRPDENGIIEGEWYSIQHTDNPKEISITIKPNTGKTRKIAIAVTVGTHAIDLLARQAAGESENSPVQWDNLIDHSTENNTDIFIGTQYIGVQNWPLIAHAPNLYVGATFPQKAFATSFDREFKGNKHPIDLTFNFKHPAEYITSMEAISGIEFLKKIKEARNSEEYKNYIPPTGPYIAKIADLKSISNLESCFPEYKDFGKTLETIAKQNLEMKNIKSLSVGKIIIKGFKVSMDIPTAGLFIDTPDNLSDLVYIREITYGVTAYFIIASEHSYQDVLKAFKFDSYLSLKNKSQIILLTVSDLDQEAIIKSSFDDLTEFLKNPISDKETYGYPIFCKGLYAKDNKTFIRDNLKITN